MKYFVISDIHNHYTEMKTALDDAGFDMDNAEHKIILIGDAFDRGDEAVKMFEFMKEMLSKGKIVWIAGNHELYIKGRFERGVFSKHGNNDGYLTMLQLATAHTGITDLTDNEVMNCCREMGFEKLLNTQLVAYFETPNYVFIHGSLPTIKATNGAAEYNPNWRRVGIEHWGGPVSKNGMKEAVVHGIKVPGKTIICGHAASAYGNARKDADPSQWDDKKYDSIQRYKTNGSNRDLYKPFYGDGVIGIDANVYKTGFVNCIVIED